MDRSNIEKIAKNADDRLFLAKVWDKILSGMRKNIPTFTNFLSPREQELCRFLFGEQDGLIFFGGYENAERTILVYLPEYLEKTWLFEEESPIVCLRAHFYEKDILSHRDFLGALMGAGISRETVGDINLTSGSCDFLVAAQIAPYILQNLSSVGRTRIQITQIPLSELSISEPEIKIIHDTVASLRLDSVAASGFRMGRSLICQHVSAGKVAVNGIPCEKPDKILEQGDKISLRGAGKMQLAQVNGTTKKGRISVVIYRYV